MNKKDYIFVSGLIINACNVPVSVRQKEIYWDMNYHGFWMHREIHRAFLIELALKGHDFSEYTPPQDYEPKW
jgi:hypothetical protein